jgi:hypothetical protein
VLAGSAAEGTADWLSDLDLITYHDQLPSRERLDAVPLAIGGELLEPIFPWSADGYGQRFDLDGLEVQAGQTTVAQWEKRLDDWLGELQPDQPWQKVLGHYLDAVPMHGEDLIAGWKARIATYPESWARPMVEHNLQLFPLWRAYDQMAARDATLWTHQMLVEGAQRVLGMLAGLNRVYWSSFQFKRAHDFEARLRWKPARLADRLDSLFAGEVPAAVAELEALVAETLDLVDEHMPGPDTGRLRATLGARHRAWGP